NSTQVERFQEDSLFNYGLTMTQLLCDPPENFKLLSFVKALSHNQHPLLSFSKIEQIMENCQ
ncbi:unnamed protein product, partial [Allacma fusca]